MGLKRDEGKMGEKGGIVAHRALQWTSFYG